MSLNDIPPVVIDANGRFKYILIKLTKNDEEQQYIVRGFASAEYHADILDDFESGLRKLKIKEVQVECMGGGRILNEANKKEILVYGYSMGYGLADHSITVELIKNNGYGDYKVTFNNEGY